MSGAIARRACYRVRQFFNAIRAGLSPLSEVQIHEAQAVLPTGAWRLFHSMPRQTSGMGLRCCTPYKRTA